MADAALMVARWKRNTAAAGQSYKEGVNKVRVSPGELAAAQQDRMLRGVTEAVTSGRWANRVRSVSLPAWQQVTSTKGATNYATGVASPQAEQKLSAFAQVWANLMNQASDAARQIDKSTEEGALQRVRLVMQVGKQFKAARSGSGY